MSEFMIRLPEEGSLTNGAAGLLATVRDLSVMDVVTDARILAFVGEAKCRIKLIKEALKEVKDLTNKAHKSVTALEAKACAPFDQVIQIGEHKHGVYAEEARRLAAEAQRKAEAEARRKVEDEALAAAAQAEAEGDTATAEAILTEPVQMDVPKVEVAIGKVEGVHTQVRYKAEVVKLMLLILWVGDEFRAGRDQSAYLEASGTNLNRAAMMQKEGLSIPGVRVVRVESIVQR